MPVEYKRNRAFGIKSLPNLPLVEKKSIKLILFNYMNRNCSSAQSRCEVHGMVPDYSILFHYQ
ncbi:hypothetical protein T01_3174 [Trichinella spiralis]|uniref:Uncharacterized protein n=1 Tax=Trichinella spiralis TaxID=6334 RepID=A0A0V1AWJ5_TRISP|nr:hypothetical protein T01_3174 [Trichinella spiralis]